MVSCTPKEGSYFKRDTKNIGADAVGRFNGVGAVNCSIPNASIFSSSIVEGVDKIAAT